MRRSLLWGHDQAVLDFVGARAPLERPLWRDVYGAIGILRQDGLLIGGVVLSDYKPAFGTLELSAVGISSHLLDTRLVRQIGAFAFGQLGTFRIFARTSDRNKRAKACLRGLGFVNEGVKAHFYGRGSHASEWRVIRPEWETKWGRIELQKAA